MPTTEQHANAERIAAAFAAAEQPDDKARDAVDRGVSDIVRHVLGDDGFRTEPMWAGSSFTRQIPDTAAAVRAVLMIRGAADYRFDRLVRDLRSEGSSWAQVAEVLGYTDDDKNADGSPAERAFYAVVPSSEYRWDLQQTAWRCNSCALMITDKGPFNPHPVDQESGHAESCARFAAEVAAYEKERGEW